MSRLHAFATTASAIAAQFGVDPAPDFGIPETVSEGDTGVAVFEHGGRRHLKRMTWGFPRFTRAMHLRGEEPGRIGLVADLTNPMWDEMVREPRYRCIIPITHFGNPDGDPGAKTRTWFSIRDQPIMAWAGFCRSLPDRGPCYAGMTMEANGAIPPTNDRMPVLLEPHEYVRWLHGGPQDVIFFQYREPFAAECMIVTPTQDKWRSGKGPPVASGMPEASNAAAAPQLALGL